MSITVQTQGAMRHQTDCLWYGFCACTLVLGCVGAAVPSAFPSGAAGTDHASHAGVSGHLSPGRGLPIGPRQGAQSQHLFARSQPGKSVGTISPSRSQNVNAAALFSVVSTHILCHLRLGRQTGPMHTPLSSLYTTCDTVCAQDLDFAILYESQLLENLLHFADEAVRLLTAAHIPGGLGTCPVCSLCAPFCVPQSWQPVLS